MLKFSRGGPPPTPPTRGGHPLLCSSPLAPLMLVHAFGVGNTKKILVTPLLWLPIFVLVRGLCITPIPKYCNAWYEGISRISQWSDIGPSWPSCSQSLLGPGFFFLLYRIGPLPFSTACCKRRLKSETNDCFPC